MATRYSQPQSGARIDWSNPLCRGLAFVSVGDNPVSLVTGGAGTLVGTVSKTVGLSGKCLQTVHGAANRIDYANGCIPSTNGEISFGSVFMSVADTGALQYLINRDAFQNLFTLRSASMYLQITWNGVGIVYGTVPAVAGAWNVGSGSSPTVGNTTGGKIYVNGNNGIQSSTAGAIGSAGSPIVLLNGRVSDNLRQLNGAQALSVSWNRVLSDAEHASFNANPWQIFQPANRQLFVPSAGAPAGAFLGWFDGELRPDGWFDAELQAAGWWDTEIIQTAGGGGGGSDGFATGAFSGIALSVPSATATGTFSGFATGSVNGLSLSQVAATAVGTTNATATGSVPGLALGIISATASGTTNGSASGSLVGITLTTITAAASGTTDGSAVGLLPSVALSSVLATASGTTDATATGSIPGVTLAAPTATAFGTTSGNGSATGAVAGLTLSTIAATALGTANATASGSIAGVTLGTVSATASGGTDGTATGALVGLSLTPPSGSAAGTDNGLAIGALPGIALAPVSGTASGTANATASGAFAPISLGVLTGTATGGASSYTISDTRANLIYEIALLHGLVPGNPLVVSPTSRTAGAVSQTITGTDTVTMTTTSSDVLHGSLDAWIDALAAIHGLTTPLVVTATGRTAGSIAQTLDTVSGTTTVTSI